MLDASSHPDRDRLYETAAAQSGYFTTKQAADAGYSTHLLYHHIAQGWVRREQRGIYRLAHFPYGEHDALVIAWLWSEQLGVVSHNTALLLHHLSDVLPTQVHLTLPMSSSRRRLRVPVGIVVHHDDLAPAERTWLGTVPLTSVARTLNDCARAHLSPELLRQGAQQALGRGLVLVDELRDVEVALARFGGIR